MSEQLIIRLASEAHQRMHWLMWSESEKEIIGSGEIDNAEALNDLTEKAQTRKVICLVPGMDVTLKSVPITGNFTRQMQQALPYMLEDELASDVDKLHFSVIAKAIDLVHVAICFKAKIAMWLDWLNDANIVCTKLLPEVLTLPLPTDFKWQAVQLGEYWLIRESLYQGWSCDRQMLNDMMSLRLIDNEQQIIENYTPRAIDCVGTWQDVDPILPMQLLSEGSLTNRFTILTGEFKPKKESQLNLKKWRIPVFAAGLLFILLLVGTFVESKQIEAQTLQVKEQVEEVYKKAFPRETALRYSRIKKKLKGLLADISGSNNQQGLLIMLNELLPVFKSVPSLEISTLKFSGSKKEITLAVSADSFQAFEKLSEELPNNYYLEQGTLNSSKNRVSGSLTLGVK